MLAIYEEPKENFTSFNQFQNQAQKKLIEIYGGNYAIDQFKFQEMDTTYRCQAFRYDESEVPSNQKIGTVPAEGFSNADVSVQDEDNDDLIEIEATDAAIKLAEEYNVDLQNVKATGKTGDILLGDVEKYINDNNLAPAQENAGNATNNEQQSNTE